MWFETFSESPASSAAVDTFQIGGKRRPFVVRSDTVRRESSGKLTQLSVCDGQAVDARALVVERAHLFERFLGRPQVVDHDPLKPAITVEFHRPLPIFGGLFGTHGPILLGRVRLLDRVTPIRLGRPHVILLVTDGDGIGRISSVLHLFDAGGRVLIDPRRALIAIAMTGRTFMFRFPHVNRTDVIHICSFAHVGRVVLVILRRTRQWNNVVTLFHN